MSRKRRLGKGRRLKDCQNSSEWRAEHEVDVSHDIAVSAAMARRGRLGWDETNFGSRKPDGRNVSTKVANFGLRLRKTRPRIKTVADATEARMGYSKSNLTGFGP